MIHKCRELDAFKFKNKDIFIELDTSNPVYGKRLVIYKIINPLKKILIYDEVESSSCGLNGWLKNQYNEKISNFVEDLLRCLRSNK